jgi:hypothetical protein
MRLTQNDTSDLAHRRPISLNAWSEQSENGRFRSTCRAAGAPLRRAASPAFALKET